MASLRGVNFIEGTNIARVRIHHKGSNYSTLVTSDFKQDTNQSKMNRLWYAKINQAVAKRIKEIDDE